jgi:hypothetical protein
VNRSNCSEENGRDAEIRTRDPLTPSQVRYQAALHPADDRFSSDACQQCGWGRAFYLTSLSSDFLTF